MPNTEATEPERGYPSIEVDVLSGGSLFMTFISYSRDNPNLWYHIPATRLQKAPDDIELPHYASNDPQTMRKFFQKKGINEGSEESKKMFYYYPFNLTQDGRIQASTHRPLNRLGCIAVISRLTWSGAAAALAPAVSTSVPSTASERKGIREHSTQRSQSSSRAASLVPISGQDVENTSNIAKVK